MADAADLAHLADIVLPDPIAWWPPAPGMVMAAGLALIWLLAGAAVLWRRRQRNAYRREALAELDRIDRRLQDDAEPHRVLVQISTLLKRAALAAGSREQIAALSGQPWTAFLDRTGRTTAFTRGSGHLLANHGYQPPGTLEKMPGIHLHEVIQACRQWIQQHPFPLTDRQRGHGERHVDV